MSPKYGSSEIPVFRPTLDEFADFARFVTSINEQGQHYGLCKVVPPPEWKQKLHYDLEMIDHLILKEPIKQKMEGFSGVYLQSNRVYRKKNDGPGISSSCRYEFLGRKTKNLPEQSG